MKAKNTLILLAVLVAIVAYVYFYEIKGGEERKKEKEAASELLPIKKEDVSGLILERPAENIKIKAVKKDDQWEITEPVKTAGDRFAIEGVINSVLNSKIERVVAKDTASLKDFGLKPPEAVLILIEKSGKKDTVSIGSKNPTNAYLYIRRDHRPKVELTSASMSYQTSKKLIDLRDKTVLKFENENVERLVLKTKTGRFVLEKSGDTWQITSSIRKSADKSEVEKLLNKVKNARVNKFVVEKAVDLQKYGLRKPSFVFTVYLKPNQARKTLFIGKKTPGGDYYAKDDSRDPIMSISKDVPEGLQPTLFDLRNKKILTFKRADLAGIKLIYKDTTIVCEKDTSNKWVIAYPESAKAKSWKISSLLAGLENLKAAEFLGESKQAFRKAGFRRPELIVHLYDKDKNLVESLYIGRSYDAKKNYVTNRKKKEVFGVSSDDLKTIEISLNELKTN